jgi:hypothetical protein
MRHSPTSRYSIGCLVVGSAKGVDRCPEVSDTADEELGPLTVICTVGITGITCLPLCRRHHLELTKAQMADLGATPGRL